MKQLDQKNIREGEAGGFVVYSGPGGTVWVDPAKLRERFAADTLSHDQRVEEHRARQRDRDLMLMAATVAAGYVSQACGAVTAGARANIAVHSVDIARAIRLAVMQQDVEGVSDG